jgi:hypothetical protein
VKTDELIVQLAKSAEPVTPLPPLSIRLAQWLGLAIALAAVGVFAIGPRADLGSVLTRPVFAASLLALLVATVSSAAAAFVLSVPGAERSAFQRVLPILATAAWPVAWLLAMSATTDRGTTRLFHAACAIEIAVVAGISGAALLAMLRRAAPLRPGWTAAIASLAAVAIGAAMTQIICPIDDPAHVLIGHVLVAVLVGLVGCVVGYRALTRHDRP